MRKSLLLILTMVVLAAGSSLMTSAVIARSRLAKITGSTTTESGRDQPRPSGLIAVPSNGMSKLMGPAQFDVDGKTVEIQSQVLLTHLGGDFKILWSVNFYNPEDKDRQKPLDSENNLDHVFTIPGWGKIEPTFDHRVRVPLPAGDYIDEVAVLSVPPQVHRNQPIDKISRLIGLRSVSATKLIHPTD